MEEQETIIPEYEEINKVHEIKIKDNKIIIRINNDKIIITLIKELSYYKYIKKYEYKEIKKEFELFKYKNLEEIYNYLINSKFKIINEETIIINNNKKIKLNEAIMTNEEVIKILIDEMRDIKNTNIKQNEIIRELREANKAKDNIIYELENKYYELNDKINYIMNQEIENEDLQEGINELKNEIKIIRKQQNKVKNKFEFSTIISANEYDMISDWISPNKKIELNLLYRASRDGDKVKDFHDKCDNFLYFSPRKWIYNRRIFFCFLEKSWR